MRPAGFEQRGDLGRHLHFLRRADAKHRIQLFPSGQRGGGCGGVQRVLRQLAFVSRTQSKTAAQAAEMFRSSSSAAVNVLEQRLSQRGRRSRGAGQLAQLAQALVNARQRRPRACNPSSVKLNVSR